MSDDNIIPFPGPKHDKAEGAAQFDRQWSPPQFKEIGRLTPETSKILYRQLSSQTFEQEIRRATVHLDTRPRWRRGWPGWWKLHGARIQFAAVSLFLFAAFAYICAAVTAGPLPWLWGWFDWAFVIACLFVGAGFVAAQER
jgi:hypothetical protein